MLASILLLLLAAGPPPPDGTEQISPQGAAMRASRCGLGPVTARYVAELQEDVLMAAAAGAATDAELACADKAAGYYALKLPASLQPRYETIREARLTVALRRQARAWLSARGLLGRLPEYRKGVTDEAAFAGRIETLCGPQAKGALHSQYGFHALNPDWALGGATRPGRFGTALECLMNATSAAGYQIYFIGNEAYSH